MDKDELEAQEILANYNKDMKDIKIGDNKNFTLYSNLGDGEDTVNEIKKIKTNIIISSVLLGILIIGYVVTSIVKHEDPTMIIIFGVVVLVFAAIIGFYIYKEVKTIKNLKDDETELPVAHIISGRLVYFDGTQEKQCLLYDIKKLTYTPNQKETSAGITIMTKDGEFINFENIKNYKEFAEYIKNSGLDIEIL